MRKLLLLNMITIIVVTLTACSVIEKPESFTTAVTSSKKNTSYDAKATASLPQPVEIQIESDFGETEAFSYDIKYPVISNLQNQNTQATLNTKLKNQVYNYMNNFKSLSKSNLKAESFVPYSVTTDFEIKTSNQNILSMVATYTQNTGKANPVTALATYNIDTSYGKELSLEDLFKSDFDYKNVINKEITNQIKKDISGKVYFKEKNLRFVSISQMQQFYIEDGNLYIQFGIYEIAPYATGAPVFLIPNELIDSGLKEQYKPMLLNQVD